MANTYQKVANNTCDILQGLTYATIQDSIRQTQLQMIISTIVPLIQYEVGIQIVSQYLAIIELISQYNEDISILPAYDLTINIEQEVRA